MLAVHHDHLKLFLAEGSTPSLRVDTSDGTGTLFVSRGTGSFHSSGSRCGSLELRRTLFGQWEGSIFTNCKLAGKFHVLLLLFHNELGRSVSHCVNWHHLLPLRRGIPRRRRKLLPLVIATWTIYLIFLSEHAFLEHTTLLGGLVSFV
jgi:hypothetical protein